MDSTLESIASAVPESPSTERLLQLNSSYFQGRSADEAMKVMLRPTILMLETILDACSRGPPQHADHPEVEVDQQEPSAEAEEEEEEDDEAAGDEEAAGTVPVGEPVFTKKSSIGLLSRFFAKLMRQRLKRLKHKCRWCCAQRQDMPYWSALETKKDGGIVLEFVHGTVAMTDTCNLAHCSSILAVDAHLHLNGVLVAEAWAISGAE